MGELLMRRRMISNAPAPSGITWLYKDGVIYPAAQGFNTDGYKYGTYFGQSIESDCLHIYATNQYGQKGGRTYTADLPIASSLVGKVLHVTGDFENASNFVGGRSSGVYAVVSDSVADDGSVLDPMSSSAFANPIYSRWQSGDMTAHTTINFELILNLTKVGFLSVLMFKNYNGLLKARIRQIWIE